MTEKRFTIYKKGGAYYLFDNGNLIIISDGQPICDLLNQLNEENEQLKQQKMDLLNLIENNIEIYENINTNVEFHKGEIQGKLTLLYNLRELILK